MSDDLSVLTQRIHELEMDLQRMRSEHGQELARVTTQARLTDQRATETSEDVSELQREAGELRGTLNQLTADHHALRKTVDTLLLQLAAAARRSGGPAAPASGD